MTRTKHAPLAILPPPARRPLTVAEALRNIAQEALERRRQRAASAEKAPVETEANPNRPTTATTST
jgi:hypothetical protein